MTRSLSVAGLAASLVLIFGFVGAQAAMSQDEIKKKIEAAFSVQVLRIEAADVDGKAAFMVRVMSKDLVTNGGLQVTTLGVDAETGDLIPAFRHRASGYATPEALSGEPKETNVPSSGSTWR